MLKNHVKTAFRSLKRNTYYTGIHIVGLGVAIACGLFIYRYVTFHLRYDDYHRQAASTYKVVSNLHMDQTSYNEGVSYATYEALKNKVPGIDRAVFSIGSQRLTVRAGQQLFDTDKKVAFADSGWFGLFDYRWLAGPPGALDRPQTVALMASTAKRLFGNEDAMGKTIYVEQHVPLQVVGVIDEPPSGTTLKNDLYVSFSSFKTIFPNTQDNFFTDWGYNNSTNNIYVSLSDNMSSGKVEHALQLMTNALFGEESGRMFEYKLLPLTELHFDGRYGGTVQRSLLTTLGAIGMAVLLMALLNYVNLSLAQYARRSAEIGTRKVLGSSRRQLFNQFMVESLGVSGLATAFGIGLLLLAMPMANTQLFQNEPLAPFDWPQLLAASIITWLSIGLLSGIYPAWAIGRLQVLRAMKQQVSFGTSKGKKAVVVIQNALSQCLLMATVVMMVQVHYLRNTDVGFDREYVLMVSLPKIAGDEPAPWRTFLDAQPSVLAYSFCFRSPANHDQRGGTLRYDDRADWESWAAKSTFADSAYLETFGINLLAGRNFRTDASAEEYLINETMMRQLGVEDPSAVLGKSLLYGGMYGESPGTIVGVVGDYNTHSLREPIQPTVIGYHKDLAQSIAIKLNGQQTAPFIDRLEREWAARYPGELLRYQFVDAQIEHLYASERILQKLIWVAAAVAILIGCLGLLGLISLNVLQRTKEIGIRKVLGATVTGIVTLLAKDFVKLVGIAILLALPIAWWMMDNWLEDFVYRIDIQWWMFAAAGIAAVVIALFTVGWLAIRAAVANPVESLRDE